MQVASHETAVCRQLGHGSTRHPREPVPEPVSNAMTGLQPRTAPGTTRRSRPEASVKAHGHACAQADLSAARTRASGRQFMCADAFHVQAVDLIEIRDGHFLAIFTEAHVIRGVERSTHTVMHTLIHRLCG